MKFHRNNYYIPIILIILCSSQYSYSQSALITEDVSLSLLIPQKNLKIVDVRSRSAYLRSHIEGAVNQPVSETFSIGNRDDLVAPLNDLITKFGDLGISINSKVVLYDDGSFIDASRVFWILEMIGQTNVSILNLGFSDWKEKGYPVSSKTTNYTPINFVPSVSPDRLATYLKVKMLVNKVHHTIIDTRPETEFNGWESKTGRFGHIPSSINIPFDKNINGSISKIKTIEQLKDLYKDIDKNNNVTVYCNKGKQSALSYFVLRNLGYKVSAYDGSWFEWGELENFPQKSLSKELDKEILLTDTIRKVR